MTIYLLEKTQIVLSLIEKIIILDEYLNNTNIFLKKLAKILLEHTKINKYIIEINKGKKSLYGLSTTLA